MRRLSVLFLVMALPLFGATPAFAADTAPPVIEGATISPNTVAVSGINLAPVTVSVHLTDADGVIPFGQMDGSTTPLAVLERVSGGTAFVEGVPLNLTSGTAQDGTWSSTVQVPSTWDGHWELTRVIAYDGANNNIDVDPRESSVDASLDVDGTHIPAMTFGFTPDPVIGAGQVTVRGRFYFQDTNTGIPNVPIYFGFDNLCVEGGNAVPNGQTGPDGTYSRTLTATPFLHCVGIPRPSSNSISPAFIVVASGFPRIRPVLTATASGGARITVQGTVVPAFAASTVELQLRVGSTWRTVDTFALTVTGGSMYTMSYRAAAGTYQVRVIAPSEDPELVGVSRTLTVQVGDVGPLPVTGDPILPLFIGAGVLLLVGIGLVLLTRRRRSAADEPSEAGS